MNCQPAIWPDAHHTLITTTQSHFVFTRVKHTGMEAEHEQYHVGWHRAALRPIYAHWLLNQVTWTIPWHGNIYMHASKLEHLQQECWIVKKQIKLICNNLSYMHTNAHAHTRSHTHTQAPLHPPTLPLKPKTQQCKQKMTNTSSFVTKHKLLHAADHVRKSITQHEQHAVPSETSRGQPETPVYFRLCHVAWVPGSQHGSSSNLHPLCLASEWGSKCLILRIKMKQTKTKQKHGAAQMCAN